VLVLSRPPRQMLLIQRLSQKSFNHRLTADIQLPGCLIEFLKHRQREIHIHALNRRHHLALGETTGDVLATVGKFRDFIGGRRLGGIKCFRHTGITVILFLYKRKWKMRGNRCRNMLILKLQVLRS
jgi:hypothetical protein